MKFLNLKYFLQLRLHFLVIFIFLGLSVFLTWPLAPHFTDSIPGGGDAYQNLWNYWWLNKALFELRTTPYRTDFVFYPQKVFLFLHTLAPLNGLISVPFEKLWGLVAASNLMIFLSFILTGYGMFLFLWFVTEDFWAALAGAFVLAFCPYRMSRLLGQYNYLGTQWLPFFLLFLVRFHRQGKFLNLVLVVLFLWLSFFTDYYYFIFSLAIGLLYILWFFRSPEKLRSVFLALLVGALPALLFLFLVFSFKGAYEEITGWAGAGTNSLDLGAIFVPSFYHPFWGRFFKNFYRLVSGVFPEYLGFVGWTLILVFIFSWAKLRRQMEGFAFWALAVGLFFIFSLGPVLHIAGRIWFIPLPFAAIHYVPVLNHLRLPARFNLLTVFSLAVIFAFFMKWLFRQRRHFLGGVVFLAVFVEYLAMPIPLKNLGKASAVFTYLRQQPGQFALLEIPLGWKDGFRQVGDFPVESCYYQTIHEKKIFGGYLSRMTSENVDYFLRDRFFSSLIKLQTGEKNLPVRYYQKPLQPGLFKYVVFYNNYLRPAVKEKILNFLSSVCQIKLVLQDKNFSLYEVVSNSNSSKKPLKVL